MVKYNEADILCLPFSFPFVEALSDVSHNYKQMTSEISNTTSLPWDQLCEKHDRRLIADLMKNSN